MMCCFYAAVMCGAPDLGCDEWGLLGHGAVSIFRTLCWRLLQELPCLCLRLAYPARRAPASYMSTNPRGWRRARVVHSCASLSLKYESNTWVLPRLAPPSGCPFVCVFTLDAAS